jgi:hypothetical protein
VLGYLSPTPRSLRVPQPDVSTNSAWSGRGSATETAIGLCVLDSRLLIGWSSDDTLAVPSRTEANSFNPQAANHH